MSGGQDWAAEVHRDMDNPVDTPNLAHRISVLRREPAKERRATESAVELLRVIGGSDRHDHKSEGTVFVANVKVGDRVQVGETVIEILDTLGENRVRLGIDSPAKVKVLKRNEVDHVTEPAKT